MEGCGIILFIIEPFDCFKGFLNGSDLAERLCPRVPVLQQVWAACTLSMYFQLVTSAGIYSISSVCAADPTAAQLLV